MTCSRCGAEAAVKRDAAFYCGKCALARDWEDIIAIVQSDGGGSLISFEAATPIEPTVTPAEAAHDAPVAVEAAVAEAPVAEAPVAGAPAAEGSEESVSAASGELPADPFA